MLQFIASRTAITATLISIGALLMIISLVRYRKMLSNQDKCRTSAGDRLKILHIAHLVLMAFFIFGYLVVLVSLLAGIHFVSEFLVSVIFFSGAVFVFFGVVIQERMLTCLQETHTKSVKMLVSAVEIRDPYTIGHSEHVANLLLMLHGYLPRNIRDAVNKNALEHAGLLHDIGKIGVPETILNKTTKLSGEEWKMVREHPEIGSALLGNLEELGCIAHWIKYHHERVDGNGYYGLSESSIPYVSKMIAVVDTYSALVTDRPYRRGKSHAEALEIILESVNTQLDAEIAGTLASIPEKHIDSCRPDALVRDFIKEHRLVDSFSAEPHGTSRIDIILPQEPGAKCFAKLLDYAVQRRFHLSFAVMRVEKLSTIDREYGYHAADELIKALGNELLQRIRETDVIMQFHRSTFILALADYQSSLASRLIQRIQKEIRSSSFFQPYGEMVTFSPDIIHYSPLEDTTLEQARLFVNSLA